MRRLLGLASARREFAIQAHTFNYEALVWIWPLLCGLCAIVLFDWANNIGEPPPGLARAMVAAVGIVQLLLIMALAPGLGLRTALNDMSNGEDVYVSLSPLGRARSLWGRLWAQGFYILTLQVASLPLLGGALILGGVNNDSIAYMESLTFVLGVYSLAAGYFAGALFKTWTLGALGAYCLVWIPTITSLILGVVTSYSTNGAISLDPFLRFNSYLLMFASIYGIDSTQNFIIRFFSVFNGSPGYIQSGTSWMWWFYIGIIAPLIGALGLIVLSWKTHKYPGKLPKYWQTVPKE